MTMSTHLINILNFSLRRVGFALVVCLSANAQSAEPKLPRAMAWSAYNLGTTGYNQAVGIAKMLKDEHRVTLRVIPGKNDVSRLLPLMVNRVQFSANGVSTYFAQEGVFQFTSPRWGPIPVRLVMMSLGLSNQGIAVAANSEIERIADLRSKSVPYVLGAPALECLDRGDIGLRRALLGRCSAR
jgi:TRAP transporter TAXI family solute receptor